MLVDWSVCDQGQSGDPRRSSAAAGSLIPCATFVAQWGCQQGCSCSTLAHSCMHDLLQHLGSKAAMPAQVPLHCSWSGTSAAAFAALCVAEARSGLSRLPPIPYVGALMFVTSTPLVASCAARTDSFWWYIQEPSRQSGNDAGLIHICLLK